MIVEHVQTSVRKEATEITSIVEEHVKNIKSGIVVVYVPHTTAGVTINEAFDPSVVEDLLNELTRLVPYSSHYKHLEGNADAHIQASIIGSSVTIPVENGKLILGKWQGVFFVEFDGPRNRKFFIKIIEG